MVIVVDGGGNGDDGDNDDRGDGDSCYGVVNGRYDGGDYCNYNCGGSYGGVGGDSDGL